MAKLRASSATQQSPQDQELQGAPVLPVQVLPNEAMVSEADLVAQKKKSNTVGMAMGVFIFILIASIPFLIKRFRRMQEDSEYDIPAAGGGTKRTSRRMLKMKAQRVATDELDAESASDEEDSDEETEPRSSRRRRGSRPNQGRTKV